MTNTKALIEKHFTAGIPDDQFVMDTVKWVKAHARIEDYNTGKPVFDQPDVEFPDFWSQSAVNITASKYFNGPMGTPKRENSLRQLVGRVVKTIGRWGVEGGYFDDAGRDTFERELTFLLINQWGAFNSPVWFNVGIDSTPSGYCWYGRNYGSKQLGTALGPRKVIAQDGHKPQCSACFITGPEDNMESIFDWVKTQGMIYKYGSGSGANVSTLRSSKEGLSGGGTSSGPLEFMKIADQAAGSIKSGGRTRRAAAMVILNADHPDILEFIRSKPREEKKAKQLIEAGFSAEFNAKDNAYANVFFQNANHSVRATDDFMEAVTDHSIDHRMWTTVKVIDGRPCETLVAKDVLHEIAEATHTCGDPGMQFDTTINEWNTCKNSARIDASNPCGEYHGLKDTACNLASLNLMKFRNSDGTFNVSDFMHAVHLFIVAQDILVDNASYPTAKIAENSHKFRPLGLGFANLGAYLMSIGVPYDSDEGRAIAGAITSLMTGTAYATSAQLTESVGEFEAFKENNAPMLGVLQKHKDAALSHLETLDAVFYDRDRILFNQATDVWKLSAHYRNSQVTVLAPTGTIGFMMDADTTGIEPELALVKYKKLVGGGTQKIVNQTVEMALHYALYAPGDDGQNEEKKRFLDYINDHGTPEGCLGFPKDLLPVFDTSFPAAGRTRCLSWQSHIEMMAAVQPFLSGAISKTINMPETATVKDIEDAYILAWKKGLKAVAIYRNNCKSSQPLNTSPEKLPEQVATGYIPPNLVLKKPEYGFGVVTAEEGKKMALQLQGRGCELPKEVMEAIKKTTISSPGVHRKLVGTRKAIVHEFELNGHKGYLTVGLYPDGTPGEIFVDVSKEGSTVSGLMDALAISTSFNLQHGVPLKKLVEKFSFMKFEPAGWTKELGYAHSLVDYIFRWLGKEYLAEAKEEIQEEPKLHPAFVKLGTPEPEDGKLETIKTGRFQSFFTQPPKPGYSDDAPMCSTCGSPMQRNGSCFRCATCGSTSGCS